VSVTAPRGFRAGGTWAGVKPTGSPDLAMVATAGPAGPAAGVFTRSRAPAAPVQVSRAHLRATGGRAAAVVINSGNANAATGPAGLATAEAVCAAAAGALGVAPEEVLVCSTGIIGVPLPQDLLVGAVPGLAAGLSDGPRAAEEAARAILTTDTVPKQAMASGSGFSVGAMAKGAAMLQPDMATMLAVLTTDASAGPAELATALGEAVEASFNRITVDGCTSTNDTVLLISSQAGPRPGPGELERALGEVCAELAEQMVADAEGGTKVARVTVRGASDDRAALRAARRVANSPLVKCSLHGGDPYWGRVLSELATAGVELRPERVSISYGGIEVCHGGQAAAHDAARVASHLAGRRVEVVADLGLGPGEASVLTCDLSPAYIDENMRTS
jgi:glutamate N-acetyltransferase/amino-acid N-acetyltransferase